jgi:hypothetical protein
MQVPTEADWGDYQADLDQTCAHKLFAGRTNQEMLPHFRSNVIERADELRWMPEVPFRYYVLGFRDFVMAGQFEHLEGSDAASCFLSLVLEKLEKQPGYILPIMPDLLPAVRHVAMNQASFDANERTYGSFQEKLGRIEALYETLGHS